MRAANAVTQWSANPQTDLPPLQPRLRGWLNFLNARAAFAERLRELGKFLNDIVLPAIRKIRSSSEERALGRPDEGNESLLDLETLVKLARSAELKRQFDLVLADIDSLNYGQLSSLRRAVVSIWAAFQTVHTDNVQWLHVKENTLCVGSKYGIMYFRPVAEWVMSKSSPHEPRWSPSFGEVPKGTTGYAAFSKLAEELVRSVVIGVLKGANDVKSLQRPFVD